MLIEKQHPHNKSLTVCTLGKPNTGKSSLINNFLGFDLSIVSSKPQTTRNRFSCVTVIDRTEIVFVDSPGLHKSSWEINLRMNQEALFASQGADLNLIFVDQTAADLKKEIDELILLIPENLGQSWLVFSKNDLIERTSEELQDAFNYACEKIANLQKYFSISSKSQDNIHLLTAALCEQAPSHPHLYPNGDVSNKNVRFFAAEYIREQLFKKLRDEIPYECAVIIEEFKDTARSQEENPKGVVAQISAAILVNRPSQRAIVVGSGGSVIKEIGSKARAKIEALMGGQIMLKLHVKVLSKWFNNNFVLEELGLPRAPKSHRVWRKK